MALLEQEFAAADRRALCLAVASGGYALGAALRALRGGEPGMPVLTNAFTLAPVPGAIAALGAPCRSWSRRPRTLTIDLDRPGGARIAASGSEVLLLSHMRGHVCDMGAI